MDFNNHATKQITTYNDYFHRIKYFSKDSITPIKKENSINGFMRFPNLLEL